MSSSWEIQLVETAKEELEILQTQYPNRFAYLKSDLQSFISHLRDDHAPPRLSDSSSVVLTQGTLILCVRIAFACLVLLWTDNEIPGLKFEMLYVSIICIFKIFLFFFDIFLFFFLKSGYYISLTFLGLLAWI